MEGGRERDGKKKRKEGGKEKKEVMMDPYKAGVGERGYGMVLV